MKWIAPILVYLVVSVGMFYFQDAWGALIGFHIAIVLSLCIAKPAIPIKTLSTGNSLKWLLIMVPLCASTGLTLYLLWEKFGVTGDIPTRVEALGLNASNWVTFIAYFTLVNPLVEEYFWRGYLGSNTRNLAASDFLYSGFHGLILWNKVPPIMILCSLAVLVLAGWFWRQIARIDGGLRVPVAAHMTADLAILLAVYWRLQSY